MKSEPEMYVTFQKDAKIYNSGMAYTMVDGSIAEDTTTLP